MRKPFLKLSMSKVRYAVLITLLLSTALFMTGCSGNSDNKSRTESIVISGREFSSDAEEVIVDKIEKEEYPKLKEFKQLKKLDVSALNLSVEDYQSLSSQLDDSVVIRWTVPLTNQKVANDVPELSFTGNLSSDDAYAMQYFHHLSSLTITGTDINRPLYDAVSKARELNPGLSVNCSFKIYGGVFDNSDGMINLNDVKIDSLDVLCQVIELFPEIKTVEMCNCGLSDEIMQGLREEYPDVKFVWMIHFLNYTVRTDIQVFSTLAVNLNRPGNSKTLAPLFRYCTELRALDLGHMGLTDISEIRNLKKLHTLILADNYIRDISPLADLKELVYVELFFNYFTDVSPLLALPNLEDLNLCYDKHIENATVLTGCKKLKRLYISHSGLSYEEIQTLKNGIPADCEFNYTADNAVHSGWRTTQNARNTKIREAFKNWRNVKEYPTWDNIIYY